MKTILKSRPYQTDDRVRYNTYDSIIRKEKSLGDGRCLEFIKLIFFELKFRDAIPNIASSAMTLSGFSRSSGSLFPFGKICILPTHL
jgi:hypothetical protein